MDGRELPSSQSYTDSGPISVSDLLKSTTSNNATKKRKEFRRQKPTDHARDSANKAASRDGVPLEQPTEPHTNSSTIEAPILNRLRSRLDPIYNPSSDMPSQAAADSDSSAAPVEKSVKRTKKKRKGKKPRNTEEEATQDSVDQPVATVTALSTETDKPADNTTGWYSVCVSYMGSMHTRTVRSVHTVYRLWQNICMCVHSHECTHIHSSSH